MAFDSENPKVSVVILTKDEEANLPDCLASLNGLACEVFVVDSGSTDATLELARAGGCIIAENPWVNYAVQRNWAFNNLDFKAEWVLSLDADERLLPEMVREITSIVENDPTEFNGYMLRKRTYFLGKWIRFGGHYPSHHLRLARRGTVRCEDRLYDQHFIVEGNCAVTKNDYVDILTDSITSWTDRHNVWATLEAREIYDLSNPGDKIEGKFSGAGPISKRRWLREGFYQRFPLFLRPLMYFVYRYVVRLGFLDGTRGLIFHFLQGFWFRFLVDAKIYEMRQNAQSNSTD